jgi:hypothetical protein
MLHNPATGINSGLHSSCPCSNNFRGGRKIVHAKNQAETPDLLTPFMSDHSSKILLPGIKSMPRNTNPQGKGANSRFEKAISTR